MITKMNYGLFFSITQGHIDYTMATAREILETLFQSSPHVFCVTKLFCHLHKNSDLKRKRKKASSNRWCAGGCWLAPITNRGKGWGEREVLTFVHG
jgi:hypothetical protein